MTLAEAGEQCRILGAELWRRRCERNKDALWQFVLGRAPSRPSRPPTGKVYALWLRGTSCAKIGYTAGPVAKRAAAIQQCIPYQVQIIGARPGTYADEREAQRLLSDYRVHGEWFYLDGFAAEALTRWVGGEVNVAQYAYLEEARARRAPQPR